MGDDGSRSVRCWRGMMLGVYRNTDRLWSMRTLWLSLLAQNEGHSNAAAQPGIPRARQAIAPRRGLVAADRGVALLLACLHRAVAAGGSGELPRGPRRLVKRRGLGAQCPGKQRQMATALDAVKARLGPELARRGHPADHVAVGAGASLPAKLGAALRDGGGVGCTL